MTIELVHPDDVNKVDVHHQVSIARGTRLISLAGQVSWDAAGTLVGEGDLATQTEQCYLNIAAALRAADATVSDLTRVTAFVVDLDRTKTAQIVEGRSRAAATLGVEFQQPGTFVGVTSLFDHRYLIEIEATAVTE